VRYCTIHSERADHLIVLQVIKLYHFILFAMPVPTFILFCGFLFSLNLMRMLHPDAGDMEPINGKQGILPSINTEELANTFQKASNGDAYQGDADSILYNDVSRMNLGDGE